MTDSTEPRTIPAYVGRYVADSLPEIVSEEGEVQLRLIEPPTKREIYRVDFPSGNKFVLRAFENKSLLRRYAAAIGYTRGKPLPLARGIQADARHRTKTLFKRWFCVEEFVEGALFDPAAASEEQANTVLSALAALHGETSSKWGRLDRSRDRSYKNHLLASIDKVFEELAHLATGPTFGELGLWHGWFAFEIEQMAEPESFSLIYQHIVPGNILIPDGGGRAVILGSGHLRFGHWAQDVEQAVALLAKGDAEKRAEFVSRYMAMQTHLPAGTDYEAASIIFRARYHLLRLRSLLWRKSQGKKIREEAVAEILRIARDMIR